MSNEEKGIFLYGAGVKDHDVNDVYGSWMAKGDLEGTYMWFFTQLPETNYAVLDMSPEP